MSGVDPIAEISEEEAADMWGSIQSLHQAISEIAGSFEEELGDDTMGSIDVELNDAQDRIDKWL